MADERDFRVRAFLFIENEGVARGLYNHVLGVKDDAVDINPGEPNAEMRYVKLEDTIDGFEAILKGELDEYSERAFLFAGTIDEVIKRGKAEAA